MTLRHSIAGLAVLLACARASGSATGLNTIPTTDLVPLKSFVLQVQNGNSYTGVPALYSAPDVIVQSQFSINGRLEAGLDYLPTPSHDYNLPVANAKYELLTEDDDRPNMAVGVENLARGQSPSYYITLSKTLNYDQEQRERFRAHHRRNRKLLGRRIHVGMFLTGDGTLQPFAGTDLQLNESTVFQADWINGTGNAISAGLAYVLKDNRTVVNPALLFSNDRHRLDGVFLNLSHQFNL